MCLTQLPLSQIPKNAMVGPLSLNSITLMMKGNLELKKNVDLTNFS